MSDKTRYRSSNGRQPRRLEDRPRLPEETAAEEAYYMASSWVLMRRSFGKHKLAIFGGVFLLLTYLCAIFAGFLAPHETFQRHPKHLLAPPVEVHFFHEGKLRVPFVYGFEISKDPVTLARIYEVDETQVYPIKFFVRGDEYRFWGLFKTDLHLMGVAEPGKLLLFGTDVLGRDMFSRVLAAARVSLSIGLIGVAISFILGCIMGGISGYFGGTVDMVIQRAIEFLESLPDIPLWMALAAAIPITWPPLRIYFMITIILSIKGWTGLARIVRGKILQLRAEDYVMAAIVSGATEGRIIGRHLLPGFMSYLIVSLTLAVPGMILGETALSFIGIGLRPPVVSWGVMLQQAQNVRVIAITPWLLIPAIFVVVTVLAFNFVGDGLRDAADPYK